MIKPHLDVDEIIEHFTLLPPEIDFLGSNNSHNHLGKALVLKFFQSWGRFPEGENEFTPAIIEYVAQQLNLPSQVIKEYNWAGRTISVHRGQIRELLGFQKATLADEDALRDWMMGEVIPHEHRGVYLEQLCYQRLLKVYIEAPTKGQMGRVIKSALHRYEQSFFADTATHLSPSVKENLRQLIYKNQDLAADIDLEEIASDDSVDYPIHDLKSGAGGAKVTNIKKVAKRLELLQKVGLPHDLFEEIPLRFLRQYQQQVAVESISHLQRREQNPQAYALLAIFCWVRQREITDQLVDLFIRILKDISLRAEHLVEREILRDFIGVHGKQQLLYRLAKAMWYHPDGIIREVLYPLVGPEKLQSLVQEAKTKGTYQRSVQTRINASYTYHYRRMLPALLEVLTFRSNNERYKPLIEALALVADYLGDKSAFYPEDHAVPMDGVIAKRWQNWIYSNDKSGRRRIRRARYELCVRKSNATNCVAKRSGWRTTSASLLSGRISFWIQRVMIFNH